MDTPISQFSATLAAEFPDVDPAVIDRTVLEVLASARIVLQARAKSPSPRARVVFPNLREVDLDA
jgi:hypothetical protein